MTATDAAHDQRLIEVGDESPERLYELFEANGWGDGLPLVAPTTGRVDAMLEHSAGSPDEVLTTLAPRFGRLTRRVVAVNAVLAGCPPEVFPVVLTAVLALSRPEANLRGVNATTHPVSFMTIVHGDIARSAGFNAGVGAFGPGNRANATVGRAIRLLMLHVAGARPGFGDAATQGQPSKYTYCAAENAEESPWPSYPASIGVNAASSVTVHCGENPHNVHDMEAEGDPVTILGKYASAMTSLGMNNACMPFAEFFVAFGPEHAQSLAKVGLDRDGIASYLHEHAALPLRQFHRHFKGYGRTTWQELSDEDELSGMTTDGGKIRIMVIGGPGKHGSVIPSWGMTRSVTLPLTA